MPHEVKHYPTGPVGYGACDCGATIRIEHGKMVGPWHACHLCVDLEFHTPSLETAHGKAAPEAQ